jgi:hypothetical protein
MADLYIYYQVPAAQAERLLPRVRAMQALVAKGAARCKLKRRPGEQDGCQTWMEVYMHVSAAFEADLAAAVAASSIMELIDGTRHTEVFTEFTPCA